MKSRAYLLIALSLGVLAACTNDAGSPANPPSTAPVVTTTTTATMAPATSTSTAGATTGAQAGAFDADYTLEAREYSFDIPNMTSGTHTLLLDNQGTQVHMAVIIRLLQGKTVDDAMAYIEQHGTQGKPPKWAKQIAFGIADPGTTAPIAAGDGGKNSADPQDGVSLPIGNYVALCFVPEGMTDMHQKPDPNVKTHADLGMIQGFTIA